MIRKFLIYFCMLVYFTGVNAENLTVIGIGRLGLCAALAFEKAGYDVLGVDVSEEYVQNINSRKITFDEPEMDILLEESQRFYATTSLENGLNYSEVIFILISTTPNSLGYDFSSLENLLTSINDYRVQNKHIVICSTVIPGFIRDRAKNILKDCKNTTVNYNAPNVAQGCLVNDFLNPEVVYIGGETPHAQNI